jgi:hypothetical protein
MVNISIPLGKKGNGASPFHHPYIAGVSECGRRKVAAFYFLEAQILAVQDVQDDKVL